MFSLDDSSSTPSDHFMCCFVSKLARLLCRTRLILVANRTKQAYISISVNTISSVVSRLVKLLTVPSDGTSLLKRTISASQISSKCPRVVGDLELSAKCGRSLKLGVSGSTLLIMQQCIFKVSERYCHCVEADSHCLNSLGHLYDLSPAVVPARRFR